MAAKYTIPGVMKELRDCNDANTAAKYENVMIGMYLSSLLIIGAIANFIVLYRARPGFWIDSAVFLAAGAAVLLLTRSAIRHEACTVIISILIPAVQFFITYRFYEIIGPAVWSVAFINILLAMIKVSKVMLVTTILPLAAYGFYLFRHVIFVSSIAIGNIERIVTAQIICYLLLIIIAAAVHKIGSDRFYRVNQQLENAIRQKEKIDSLYEDIKDSEQALKNTLEQLKKTQEQLVRTEKMAAIGQLAAGVAHEINNPLGYVSSNVEFSYDCLLKYKEVIEAYHSLTGRLQDVFPEELGAELQAITELENKNSINNISEEIEDVYADVRDGLTRISEIVLGLKSFSRTDNNCQFEEYDLNGGIRNTLLVARNELKHSARVVEILGAIPSIEAKGNHINQVLLNIVLNAIYAIKGKRPEGLGTIMVSTQQDHDSVVCQIEDDGTGIVEKHLKDIFNPFFTTKPIGHGTGLGLSIAYDIIVNEHGGEISVKSVVGAGTQFNIRLPIRQKTEAGTAIE